MMWIGIQSLYRVDKTLFDGFNPPKNVNKENVVKNILVKCGELEIVYPNPEILREMITTWSINNQTVWQSLNDSLTSECSFWENEYSVIKNKEITDQKINGKDSTSGVDTTTEKVAGFNSENFVNSKENSVNYGGSVTRTNDGKTTSTADGTVEKIKRNVIDNYDVIINRNLNITDIITEQFKSEFCLLVY